MQITSTYTDIVVIPNAWMIHTMNWKKKMKKNTKKLNELSLLQNKRYRKIDHISVPLHKSKMY